MAGLLEKSGVDRLQPIIDAQDELPFPLANGVCTPEARLLTKLFQSARKMEFIKGANVYKISVLPGHTRGVRVVCDELVETGPFAQSPNTLLIRAANRVLQRHAAAKH